jgi:hypothetical protein
MGPLLAGDIQELLAPSVYESLIITDIPPERAFFASLLDARLCRTTPHDGRFFDLAQIWDRRGIVDS